MRCEHENKSPDIDLSDNNCLLFVPTWSYIELTVHFDLPIGKSSHLMDMLLSTGQSASN